MSVRALGAFEGSGGLAGTWMIPPAPPPPAPAVTNPNRPWAATALTLGAPAARSRLNRRSEG